MGYEHNLLRNGGHPLSLNPSKDPLARRWPERLVTPLSSCSRSRLRWSNPADPYLPAVTQCGQSIAALPTLPIQLRCGGEIAAGPRVGPQMVDNNPIERGVRGAVAVMEERLVRRGRRGGGRAR